MGVALASGRCPICTRPDSKISYDGSTLQGTCARCGPFLALPPAPRMIEALNEREQIALLAWSDQIPRTDKLKNLDSNFLRSLSTMRVPSVAQRADHLLLKMIERWPRPRTPINVAKHDELLRAAHVPSASELMFFVDYLTDQGLLLNPAGAAPEHRLITPKGFLHAEGLNPNMERDQAFVAMWFDDSLKDVWEQGFEPAITDAGWRALRISAKEHINKICDEIVFEIRRSRFLVADFTGQRTGVYYEAGFATGLGIPVVFTCKEGEQEKLHFDVRQYNSIIWHNAADLREQLSNRIGAVIGHGPIRVA